MKILFRAVLLGLVSCSSVGMVQAGCDIEKGSVRILANDFPALHAVVSAAEVCAGDGVEFAKNHNKDHKDLMVAALTSDPAEFTSTIVANGTLVTLLNEGLVRPLDDLVAKHGGSLKKNQLITIDGKIMAIAFMANAQHLFYREDILQAAGVEVPTSYADMLVAAKAIKDKGLMDHPIAGTFKSGWNLGEEFVNMFMGTGASFFKEGTAEPAINNEHGVAALDMLKALTEYMNPDFLTHDSNAVQAEWEAGKVALTNLWGSRAGAVFDEEGSTDEIRGATKLASAPTLNDSMSATTLWWDGFTISKNISDEDAEATFIALMNGVTTEMANANPDAAVWLIDGYSPGDKAVGVAAAAAAGAKPYPMLPYMGLMHTAAGAELAEFLQGSESAEEALVDIEAAYTAAAKEGGYL